MLKFLGSHDFNILIQKYFSEESEEIYQFTLKIKTTERNSAAIGFPQILYESILQSAFAISLFSWFMKVTVIYVERRFHVIPY